LDGNPVDPNGESDDSDGIEHRRDDHNSRFRDGSVSCVDVLWTTDSLHGGEKKSKKPYRWEERAEKMREQTWICK
jgi:hypothetical protein